MRRLVLATLAAIVILTAGAGTAAAETTKTGGGTFTREETSFAVLGNAGALTVVRWTELLRFEGTLDGEFACTVHGLQGASSLSFIGWCRYTGSVGDSEAGTAVGPSTGRFTFVPSFGGSVAFRLWGGRNGLETLRLNGSADPLSGTYTVTYRLAAG